MEQPKESLDREGVPWLKNICADLSDTKCENPLVITIDIGLELFYKTQTGVEIVATRRLNTRNVPRR